MTGKEGDPIATYACSDLHGRYDKFCGLLRRLDLGPDDLLYVVGDMLDRGPDGLKILREATLHPNIVPLMGNHEFSAAVCLSWLMKEVTEDSTRDEAAMVRHLELVAAWRADGGDTTLSAFQSMRPYARRQVLEDLEELDAYAEEEVGGREFVLVHTAPGHFAPDKPLEDYDIADLLFARPDLTREYYPDKLLVVGHTPTCYLRCAQAGDREENAEHYSLDIFRKGSLIDLDCGCVFTGRLGCLRLDDLEMFYV